MIDFQTANEVYDVYTRYPHKGETQGFMAGRFLVQDGKLRILEDHLGILKQSLVNGPIGHNAAQLSALASSAYLRVVAESEVADGHQIDLVSQGQEPNPLGPQLERPADTIETPELGNAPESLNAGQDGFALTTPPALFDYFSVGMREPQVIEVRGDEVYMNGHVLSRPAVDRILYTIRTGIGKLKYRKAT